MNNRIEQDHHKTKRRVGPMLGFKSSVCANIIISGVKLVHMIPKEQLLPIKTRDASLRDQLDSLAA